MTMVLPLSRGLVLAGVLALLPGTASAAPLVTAIVTAISTSVGAGVFGTALIGFAVNLVAAYGLSVVGGKKAKGQRSGGQILSNLVDPLAPAQIVYGRVRKGGPITYAEGVGTTNQDLHLAIVLAAHEIDAVETIYLNDDPVTLDGSGLVTDGAFAGKVRIQPQLGGADQVVPPDLLAVSHVADDKFRGRGIAWLYVRLTYDADVFASGMPVITAVIRGKKVFDPRSSQTAWTANAALCLRDYLMSADGLGAEGVEDASFAAMATICDEVITLPGGGTEKRYETNGIISLTDDLEPGAVLDDMATACAGLIWYGPAGWQLKVGHYPGVSGTLGLDDLRSEISIDPRAEISASFNAVQGSFADAAQNWIEVDYPTRSLAAYLTEDGGIPSVVDLPLPFTTSAHAAGRLADLVLARSREQIRLSADWGMSALAYTVGDVVELTIARYGWIAKRFEIMTWAFVPGIAPVIHMDLQEISSTVYSAVASTREIQGNNTLLPNWRDVAPVSIEVTSELRVVNETAVGVMIVTLTPGSGYIDRYEAQYRPSGATDWRGMGQSTEPRFEALNLVDGLYDVRAWAVSPFGTLGAVTERVAIEVKPFAPLPANVANFAGNIVGESLFLTWDAVSDLDLSHYRIRYSAKTSGATYHEAMDMVRRVSRPGTSVQVPAKTGTYFIKAIDKIGGASAAASSIVILDDAGDVLQRNVTASIVAGPVFDGTSVGVAVTGDGIGPYLVLGTAATFDFGSQLPFDATTGLFDGGEGSVLSSGTFYLTEVFDLGYVATSRVDAALDIGIKTYGDTFGATAGMFDAHAGLFDGDPSAFDGCSAQLLIATTNDDPTGSPVWSAWKPFVRTTATARAMKFAIQLQSEDEASSPIVRSATLTIDMPDRTEAENDLVFTGSRTVTFAYPFRVTPSVAVSVVLANGDRFILSGKTRTGFTITAMTGAVVSTNPATFDYVAKGYGKEL